MKALNVVILVAAMAGLAFAGDPGAAAPEIGIDGPTIISAIGVVTGGLLILRSRRNK
jgi:hypothetical protein